MAPHTRRSHIGATTDSHTNGASNENVLDFQSPNNTYTSTQHDAVDQNTPNLSQSGVRASKSKAFYSQAYHSWWQARGKRTFSSSNTTTGPSVTQAVPAVQGRPLKRARAIGKWLTKMQIDEAYHSKKDPSILIRCHSSCPAREKSGVRHWQWAMALWRGSELGCSAVSHMIDYYACLARVWLTKQPNSTKIFSVILLPQPWQRHPHPCLSWHCSRLWSQWWQHRKWRRLDGRSHSRYLQSLSKDL